jgi:hypothetical protein
VLLRALRDFNLGKLTSDDTSIFVGLLNDLFPKTLELVPRAVEKDFESKVRSAACIRITMRLYTLLQADCPAPCIPLLVLWYGMTRTAYSDMHACQHMCSQQQTHPVPGAAA